MNIPTKYQFIESITSDDSANDIKQRLVSLKSTISIFGSNEDTALLNEWFDCWHIDEQAKTLHVEAEIIRNER